MLTYFYIGGRGRNVKGLVMKKQYNGILEHICNQTNDVKSAEGDNIKYPKVKRAYQVEDISAKI